MTTKTKITHENLCGREASLSPRHAEWLHMTRSSGRDWRHALITDDGAALTFKIVGCYLLDGRFCVAGRLDTGQVVEPIFVNDCLVGEATA